MTRYLLLITISIIFLLLTGCAHTERKYIPSDSDIVNRNNGELVNETRVKEFIQNAETGKKDRIRVVAYTKEGDPILTDLTYNGEQLEVTRDSTRDEYGSREIDTFSCKAISVDGKKYSIIGCQGYEIPYFLADGN